MRELAIIFFSSWKFAATFPLAIYIMKMSFSETLVYANIGGIIGVVGFAYFSDFLIKLWNRYWPANWKYQRHRKKIFTKGNRRIIKIKSKFGFIGIVILSPVILSIPVGAFLTVKYFGVKSKNILWLIAGQIAWSVIYTLVYTTVRSKLV